MRKIDGICGKLLPPPRDGILHGKFSGIIANIHERNDRRKFRCVTHYFQVIFYGRLRNSLKNIHRAYRGRNLY